MMEKGKEWDVGELVDFLASHSGREGTVDSAQAALPWAPPADVYEAEDRLHVVIEIAGMKANAFEIRIDGEELIVAGERPVRRVAQATRYHSLEWNSGVFRKAIALPSGFDRSGLVVRYASGVLEITFPRKKKERKR